jgi:hypothetical protein
LLVLILIAGGAFFGLRNRGSGPDLKGVTGKFTLGAQVDVASKTIGTGGGQVVVDANGGPIAGMTVDVPAGAFDKDRIVTVSYQPITGSTFPKDVTTVSPLIDIEYGGGRANEPFKVTIPVKVAPDHFAMSFYYDDAAGRLEGIPIVAETADSVTIATDHFSWQVLTDAAANVLQSLSADSGFKPGVDDWEFPNYGSYISPGGNCFGQSVSAIYYYVMHWMLGDGALPLYNLYDNNGQEPATPDLWQDDSHAYRLGDPDRDTDFMAGTAGEGFRHRHRADRRPSHLPGDRRSDPDHRVTSASRDCRLRCDSQQRRGRALRARDHRLQGG